jgi:thymidine kinase
MFSGKTGRLLDIAAAGQRSGAAVVLVKPALDSRYSSVELVSHDGRRRPAVAVRSAREFDAAIADFDVVCLDEVQFFGAEMADVVVAAAVDRRVAVAGLDLNFLGEPFTITAAVGERADVIERLWATCGICGAPGTHTQRLSHGVASDASEPVLVAGGPELYQPRCASCFHSERR